MKLNGPIRAKIAVGILVLVALISNIRLLSRTLRSHPDLFAADEITRHEDRLAEVKECLPSYGVVGYAGDEHFGDREQEMSFYATQYALAPLIVVNAIDREWVVGCFRGDALLPQTGAGSDLILVKDLSNGVRLFRRRMK